jgi:fructoselysine 6-kinase
MASYIGAVGNDVYGQRMKDALMIKGVDISHVKTLDGNTAITHVELVDGERLFGEYDEGVLKKFKLDDMDIDFIRGHDMVVSGLWGMIEDNLEEIHSKGIPVAFDGATRPDDAACIKAIPNVDYFFFASDDGDSTVLREKMKEIYAKGPRIVVVTLGEKGSIAYDGCEFITFGIIECRVIDTMGAGDSYIAGFLKGITESQPILECMRMGAANSSVTLEYNGAW